MAQSEQDMRKYTPNKTIQKYILAVSLHAGMKVECDIRAFFMFIRKALQKIRKRYLLLG